MRISFLSIAAVVAVVAAGSFIGGCGGNKEPSVETEPAGQVKTITEIKVNADPTGEPHRVNLATPAGAALKSFIEANVVPNRQSTTAAPTESFRTVILDIVISDAEGHHDEIIVHPDFLDIGGKYAMPPEQIKELRRLALGAPALPDEQ